MAGRRKRGAFMIFFLGLLFVQAKVRHLQYLFYILNPSPVEYIESSNLSKILRPRDKFYILHSGLRYWLIAK